MLYGKHITTEGGTYSIDKLIVEIWFWMGTLTKEYLETLFELYGWKYYGCEWEKKEIDSATWITHRYRYMENSCDTSVIIELLERKVTEKIKFPQRDEDGDTTGKYTVITNALGYDRGVRLQFNPNKHADFAIVRKFFEWYKQIADQTMVKWDSERAPHWRFRRVDFAFDVPYTTDEVCLLSRKEEAYQYTTRYYGKRGKNGHTRVYDKREEHNRHSYYKFQPIKDPLTRIEWEQHNEQKVTFDKPLLFGKIPERCQWLRFIKVPELNACLKTLDKRTAKKIKENCFQEIPFDSSIFFKLLREYQEEYCLPDERHFVTFGEYQKMTDEEKDDWRTTMWGDWGATRSEMWDKLNGVASVLGADTGPDGSDDLPGIEDLEREFYNVGFAVKPARGGGDGGGPGTAD